MIKKKYKIKYKYCFSRVLDDKVHNEFVCESCDFFGSNMNNRLCEKIIIDYENLKTLSDLCLKITENESDNNNLTYIPNLQKNIELSKFLKIKLNDKKEM
jgi:hypothetical protein